jgi:hypothetical protein
VLFSRSEGWEKEHELSLKTLWGFQGFGDVPKDMTPMFPHLSANDPDVVYLLLGEYREDRYKWMFIACNPCYLLTVDMRNKIVTSAPLAGLFPDRLLSCGLSESLCEALVPFSDDSVKKQRKRKRR